MDNRRIAEIFQEIGDILDIGGANRFRVLAYQRAAQNILNLARDLKDIYNGDPEKLLELPGIGKDLAAKIVELLTTGKCQYYGQLTAQFDRGLLEILRVRGIGPRKVKLFFSTLKIDSIEKLRKAAQEGKLHGLPGMGEKSEAEILKALQDYDRHQERMTLDEALRHAEKLIAYLKKCSLVKRAEYAGSLRRMKETIGDLDILVCPKNGGGGKIGATKNDGIPPKVVKEIMDFFVKYPETRSVLGQGETKTSILLQSGVQADLRLLEEKTFGAALHYFTGSKAHNVMVRDRAKKMGLKVSEYGVFRILKARGKKAPVAKLIGGKTEEEVFKLVGLPYIIPEMREDRGEIEAGEKGKLPKPLELQDLRGDLHVHSRWSDGANEIEEIARAYREAGFEYIALTDHSKALAMVHGLTPERFEIQWDEIDEINNDLARGAGMTAKSKNKDERKSANGKKLPPFRVLKGVECDILPDGSMDLPDSCLKKFDVVVASVHSRFNLPEKDQTKRVLKAFQNPHVAIFGHPHGRLINEREAYAIDMEAIIDTAIKRGIVLEINSQPHRLDLFDYYCKMAKDRGAKFSIDSDSHHYNQLGLLRFGLAVAKRGWIEKKDVINTLGLNDLLQFLKKRFI